MFKRITEEAKGLPFRDGPWNQVATMLLYAVVFGINIFMAGMRVGQGGNPTISLVGAAIIIVLFCIGQFITWHTIFMTGQIDQIKKDTERMLTQMRTRHGFEG